MSTREIDGITWVRKHPTDTADTIKVIARSFGARLIDVRFTFQPNGSVLLARNLLVAALTPEQMEMIVEWRVSDNQPATPKVIGEAKTKLEHLRERLKAASASEWNPLTASEIKNQWHEATFVKWNQLAASKYPHYVKDVRHLTHIDVYRVLDLWGVADSAIGHAIKKLLAAGTRGAKDQDQDISEAIDCLLRRQEMNREDTRRNK